MACFPPNFLFHLKLLKPSIWSLGCLVFVGCEHIIEPVCLSQQTRLIVLMAGGKVSIRGVNDFTPGCSANPGVLAQ